MPTPFLETDAGAAAIEAGGGLLGGLISLFGPNPYKKQFKWSEKARAAKISDIQRLMRPTAPWYNIAGNLPAMGNAMNAQVNRGLNLYRGGATGTGPSYPWMK